MVAGTELLRRRSRKKRVTAYLYSLASLLMKSLLAASLAHYFTLVMLTEVNYAAAAT